MFEGGCFCGAVRYRVSSGPMFVNCCHCRDCQKQTSSGFAVNALIEADRMEVTGEVVRYEMATDSGRPHDIYRCPGCATALWSDYGRRGYMRFLRATTLDDPNGMPPDAHIFTRSKLPWVALPADVPAFEVFYDMKELWPPESLARRDAAAKGAR